jgi:hypothetical protein
LTAGFVEEGMTFGVQLNKIVIIDSHVKFTIKKSHRENLVPFLFPSTGLRIPTSYRCVPTFPLRDFPGHLARDAPKAVSWAWQHCPKSILSARVSFHEILRTLDERRSALLKARDLT